MAGTGARLVADQNMARAILAERTRQAVARRRAGQEPPAGSGSRPVPPSLPDTSRPAAVAVGARAREPETRSD
jgi:hypothetical protein